MKLFLKILFFILTMIITVGEVKSSIVVNILQKEDLSLFFQESQFSASVFENHFENSCLNGEKVVAYSERVTGIQSNVLAKGGVQYTKSSLKMGQEMHKAYKVGADGVKEFRLPSGKRVDFLDIKNSTIYELKPYNPRGIQTGTQQLHIYRQELQTMPRFQGVDWKTVLDFY